MSRIFFIPIMIFMLTGCSNLKKEKDSGIDSNPVLEKVFSDYKEYCFRNYPTWATYEGDHRYNDRLTDVSDTAVQARHDSVNNFLARLQELDDASLNENNRLNFDLFQWMLSRSLERQSFNDHYTPIGQQGGLHLSFPQLVNFQPFENVQDFENYFARLTGFEKQVSDEIANMRKGMASGLVQPKFIMEQVLKQIESMLNKPTDSIAFMLPLNKEKEFLSDKEKQHLRDTLNEIINKTLKPNYQRLHDFIQNEYLPVCREDAGIWSIPNGDKRYAYAVRYYTTTDLSPDEIFETGLSEVKRIKEEMEKVKNTIGFEGTLNEFFNHLRTDRNNFFTEKEQLMAGYREILARMDEKIPDLFGRLPKAPYELKEIEDYRAVSAPQAYYNSPPEDGSRPGYFYVNTHDLASRPIHSMTALALHEAVPGHHLQIAIAKELENVPWFRQSLPVTAYIEGWGLYAESLGYETGMYEDPIQHFGALSFEIWRACRLVVDVGIHDKKWTREEAVQYMLENSANTEKDVRSEVDRYIAWPGQALAYKIGELKIKEIRAKAEKTLGKKFDIKAFHDELLGNGALPLSLLETKMDDWLKNQREFVQ